MIEGILDVLGFLSLLSLLVALGVAFLTPRRWNEKAWPVVAVLSFINAALAVALVVLKGC
jgi:hypothetical protein